MENKTDLGKIAVGPSQISFDVTYRCNFRCKHCYNASSAENCFINDELSDEEVLSFMEDIAQMKPYNVCFCGGEPLIRKNLICKSAKLLREAGVPYVAIVTNGSYVTANVARELYESGVNRFQVSLDGKDSATHERLRVYKGSFKKAINAIKLFRQLTSDIDVAFCPTNFNYNQVPDVFKIIKDLEVSQLRIQPFMLSGRGLSNLDIIPTEEMYRQVVKDINLIKRDPKNKNRIDWGDPIDHIIRHRTILKEYSNFITIKADGGIVASPYLPVEIGNIRKYPLSEYWKNGAYKSFSLKIVQEISKEVSSVKDMAKELKNGHIKWLDEDICVDIIEDDHLFMEKEEVC